MVLPLGPLDGVRLKLDRAHTHARELVGMINAYVERSGHTRLVRDEYVSSPTWHAFKIVLREQPPLANWGVRLGEIVHDLRSALDNIMWVADPGRDSQTMFPILSKRGDWNQDRWRNINRRLRDMGPVLTVIKHVQPYHRRHAPDFEPLALLHKTNIEDKHHVVIPVALPAERFTFQYRITGDSGKRLVRQAPHPLVFDQPAFVIWTEKPVTEIRIQGNISIGIGLELGLVGMPGIVKLDVAIMKMFDEVRRVHNMFARFW